MGRKDLTEERTAEILDAFARCLVKYGLDASLDQVAAEAGMTRSIIRHYIGNREDVVNALMERITSEYVTELEKAGEQIPPDQRVDATLDYLFGESDGYNSTDRLILDVMMTASDRYLPAKQRIARMFEEFIGLFTSDLAQNYPQASSAACRGIAYSVLALALSSDSFIAIGLDRHYRLAARASAEALIRTLES